MSAPATVPAEQGKSAPREASLRVFSNDWANPEYKHLVLEMDGDAAVLPGQFYHFLCRDATQGKAFLRRPISIYRFQPETRRLEFLIKRVGQGTRYLCALTAGDHVNVIGPLGNGFSQRPFKHVALVARGVGLATLAPLARPVIDASGKLTAILSARSARLLLAREYLLEVGAHVITVTDEAQDSDEASVLRLLESEHAKQPIDYIATCGSNRLLKVYQSFMRATGCSGEVALEQLMACGIGACYCCVREFEKQGQTLFKRVCFDGPVFPLLETRSW